MIHKIISILNYYCGIMELINNISSLIVMRPSVCVSMFYKEYRDFHKSCHQRKDKGHVITLLPIQ